MNSLPVLVSLESMDLSSNKGTPLLVSLQKIWDFAAHSALTDLIKWKGEWLCVFRESDTHFAGKNGVIRILQSSNTIVWQPHELIEREGWDLRDPKLSLMPDGRLLLLAGSSRFDQAGNRVAHQTVVSFSEDSVEWTPFQVVFQEEWLWRLTWFQGIGYGISYFFSDPMDRTSEWRIRLYKTSDGLRYDSLSSFSIPGRPNEATLRFFPTGQMVVLLRRDGREDNHAWIGSSFPPYEDWLWAEASCYFGGPNFLILPGGSFWAAGRMISKSPYGLAEKMILAEMDYSDLRPQLALDSGGDCSYPGMVYESPYLYISYYSSHEWNTAIYLAKILLEI